MAFLPYSGGNDGQRRIFSDHIFRQLKLSTCTCPVGVFELVR